MSKTLTRESLLARLKATELPIKPFKSSLFGDIYIRAWTLEDEDRWEKGAFDINVKAKAPQDQVKMKILGTRALMIRLSVCNEKGELLFQDDDLEFLCKRVLSKHGTPLINEIREFNALDKDIEEELAKNSLSTPSSDKSGA